jgi:hypothetical protein
MMDIIAILIVLSILTYFFIINIKEILCFSIYAIIAYTIFKICLGLGIILNAFIQGGSL